MYDLYHSGYVAAATNGLAHVLVYTGVKEKVIANSVYTAHYNTFHYTQNVADIYCMQ